MEILTGKRPPLESGIENFEKLARYIKDKGLIIDIMANHLSPENSRIGWYEGQQYGYTYYGEYKCSKQILLIDMVDMHVDVVKVDENGHPIIAKGVTINHLGHVFKNKILISGRDGAKFYKTKEHKKKEKDECKIFCFFKYETDTMYQDGGDVIPIALNILPLDIKELASVTANGNGTANEIKFTGKDCTEQFVKWFKSTKVLGHKYCLKHFIFIGFNNSSFDNTLMFSDLLTIKDKDMVVYDPLLVGTKIYNFIINNTHKFFDLKNYLSSGSLKEICDNFKVSTDSGECISMACLFYKLKQALLLNHYTAQYSENLEDYITLPSMMYKIFKKHIKSLTKFSKPKKHTDTYIQKQKETMIKKHGLFGEVYAEKCKYTKAQPVKETEIKFSPLEEKWYIPLMRDKTGGRVQLFKKLHTLANIIGIDVCSLYPYVMAIKDNCWYPHGDHFETKEYMKDFIGFYMVRINQSALKEKGLPCYFGKKIDDSKNKNYGGNDWNCDFINKATMISSFKYEEGLKLGVEFEFVPNEEGNIGFYFKKQIKGCELFGFLLEFMKLKNEQDLLPDNEINHALRELIKLAMNAVAGKFLEALHLNKTEMITSDEQLFDYINDNGKWNNQFNVLHFMGNVTFVNYCVPIKEELKHQKPCYIGTLIYDYAHDYMYQACYKQFGNKMLIYTDTDSSYNLETDFKLWESVFSKVPVPHWPEIEEIIPIYKTHNIYSSTSKVVGSFVIIKTGPPSQSWFLAPKMYKTNDKMILKGVAQEEDYYITEGDADKIKCGAPIIGFQKVKVKDVKDKVFDELFNTNKCNFVSEVCIKNIFESYTSTSGETTQVLIKDNVEFIGNKIKKKFYVKKVEI